MPQNTKSKREKAHCLYLHESEEEKLARNASSDLHDAANPENSFADQQNHTAHPRSPTNSNASGLPPQPSRPSSNHADALFEGVNLGSNANALASTLPGSRTEWKGVTTQKGTVLQTAVSDQMSVRLQNVTLRERARFNAPSGREAEQRLRGLPQEAGSTSEHARASSSSSASSNTGNICSSSSFFGNATSNENQNSSFLEPDTENPLSNTRSSSLYLDRLPNQLSDNLERAQTSATNHINGLSMGSGNQVVIISGQGNDLSVGPLKESKQPATLDSTGNATLSKLKTSLRACYQKYDFLERLFDGTKVPIANGFIPVALIKKTEYSEKEHRAEGRVEEKEEKNKGAPQTSAYVVQVPLRLEELFQSKEDANNPRKILILGQAGSGNSTLCQYLATQWASKSKDAAPVGQVLQQKFEAVFWLKLRDLSMNGASQKTLVQILDQHSLNIEGEKPSLEELRSYLKTYEEKTLFILEGNNEIKACLDNSQSPLKDLLWEIADYPYVLMTSHPMIIGFLAKNPILFDRQLENVGFTDKDIRAYVHQFMEETHKPSEAKPFLEFLESHLGAWEAAHTPINLELLSWLWSKEKLHFSKGEILTLSKLYQKVLECVQVIYLDKVRQIQAESKEEEATPNEINNFLAHLAYNAMKEDSFFISRGQIETAFEHTPRQDGCSFDRRDQERLIKSVTDQFGFLRAIGQGGQSQLEQDHYFIHPSFQDFYAAQYIKQVLSEPRLSDTATNIIQQLVSEKYTPCYQLMLWMSAGLLYQQAKTSQHFEPLERFWKEIILCQPLDSIGFYGFYHLFLILHCLNECEANDQIPLHQKLLEQQWARIQERMEESYIQELCRCHVVLGSRFMEKKLTEVLLDHRWHGDENVMAVVRECISLKNPPEAVIGIVLNLFRDNRDEVRKSATLALRNFKTLLLPRDSVPSFLNLLKDKHLDQKKLVSRMLFDPQNLKTILEFISTNTQYADDFISYLFKEKYLFYIDRNKQKAFLQYRYQAQNVVLLPDILNCCEKHIISVAKRKGYPLDIYEPSGYMAASISLRYDTFSSTVFLWIKNPELKENPEACYRLKIMVVPFGYFFSSEPQVYIVKEESNFLETREVEHRVDFTLTWYVSTANAQGLVNVMESGLKYRPVFVGESALMWIVEELKKLGIEVKEDIDRMKALPTTPSESKSYCTLI